jgi:hypothetical protein
MDHRVKPGGDELRKSLTCDYGFRTCRWCGNPNDKRRGITPTQLNMKLILGSGIAPWDR